jgi:hypothetical protein
MSSDSTTFSMEFLITGTEQRDNRFKLVKDELYLNGRLCTSFPEHKKTESLPPHPPVTCLKPDGTPEPCDSRKPAPPAPADEQAVKCLKPDGTEESCASRQSYFEPTKRYDAEKLEKLLPPPFASAAHAQDCDKIFQRPYYNAAEFDTPPDSPEKARARAERVAYINCLAEKHETENSSKTEAPVPLPLPPNISRKVARILPPVEYDHPYNGKLTVAIVNKEQMARLCPKASLYPIGLACAYPYETMSMCQIVMITDDIIAAVGLTPKIVLRHELGHCNGWHNDHRGARILPENEWPEGTRSEDRKK